MGLLVIFPLQGSYDNGIFRSPYNGCFTMGALNSRSQLGGDGTSLVKYNDYINVILSVFKVPMDGCNKVLIVHRNDRGIVAYVKQIHHRVIGPFPLYKLVN